MVATEIEQHIFKLSMYQNGFRAGRATLDYISYLDEIIRFNPGSKQTRLREDYGFDASLVERLKMLFESNKSEYPTYSGYL